MGTEPDRSLRGRLDHPQSPQDPGHCRQRPRDEVRFAEPRCAREVLRDHPQAGTAFRRRPTYVDPAPEAFAKQLKSQGYRFVGPTSVYAFMQNVGVVNDHVHGCFRGTDYSATAR
jgi:Methyladenine glycosylase